MTGRVLQLAFVSFGRCVSELRLRCTWTVVALILTIYGVSLSEYTTLYSSVRLIYQICKCFGGDGDCPTSRPPGRGRLQLCREKPGGRGTGPRSRGRWPLPPSTAVASGFSRELLRRLRDPVLAADSGVFILRGSSWVSALGCLISQESAHPSPKSQTADVSGFPTSRCPSARPHLRSSEAPLWTLTSGPRRSSGAPDTVLVSLFLTLLKT